MIKIDWLSFVYKPDDDEKATFPDIFSAFRARFPHIEAILDETVVLSNGKGYYNAGVCWNDNIQICWDDEVKQRNFMLYDGRILETWDHGVYVSVPSTGLHYLPELLGLDDIKVEDSMYDIKPIFQALRDNNCSLSRLDIAFDDTTKRFYPEEFLDFWRNRQVKSPCHSYSFSGSKGSTFYLGSRANKILRIYDKTVESHGKIDAIRYEIETHHRYSDDLMEMILNDQFNFFDVLQKWFIRLKEKPSCESLNDKRWASKAEDLKEWVDFINSQNERLSNCVFPIHSRDVSMEKKAAWIHRDVVRSLVMYQRSYGSDALLEAQANVILRPIDQKIIEDSLRINNVTEELYRERVAKTDILRMISQEINKAFAVS